jgi:hypothetical protein
MAKEGLIESLHENFNIGLRKESQRKNIGFRKLG